jgi:hypothetical protein
MWYSMHNILFTERDVLYKLSESQQSLNPNRIWSLNASLAVKAKRVLSNVTSFNLLNRDHANQATCRSMSEYQNIDFGIALISIRKHQLRLCQAIPSSRQPWRRRDHGLCSFLNFPPFILGFLPFPLTVFKDLRGLLQHKGNGNQVWAFNLRQVMAHTIHTLS